MLEIILDVGNSNDILIEVPFLIQKPNVQAAIVPISKDMINSGIYDRLNESLCNVVGKYFHSKLPRVKKLSDLKTFQVKGKKFLETFFSDVIFVVDEFKVPLKEVIYSTLNTVLDLKYESISMPVFRMGTIEDFKENQYKKEALSKNIHAIHDFFYGKKTTGNLKKIALLPYY